MNPPVVTVDVVETFVSIQGESTWAGLPCFFIRLGGCNLRCRYCDTPAASHAGARTRVASLIEQAIASGAHIVEITGGEPLLQPGFDALAAGLIERFRDRVLVETNGSLDISRVPAGAVTIMDIKGPGSGESESMDWENLQRLRPCDEVKFVLTDEADYRWAAATVQTRQMWERCRAVLFSPVHGRLPADTLAQWILRDRLPARVHLQLHKLLGMA